VRAVSVFVLLALSTALGAPLLAAAGEGPAPACCRGRCCCSGEPGPTGSDCLRAACRCGHETATAAPSLPPDTWSITADLAGFKAASLDPLALGPGEARQQDIPMSLMAVTEKLTVVGAAPRDSLEAASIRESDARDAGEALAALSGVWRLRKGGIASDVARATRAFAGLLARA
jgi:hypothetical protein